MTSVLEWNHTKHRRGLIELVYRDLLAKECLNREINNAEKITLDCLAKVYNEMSMYIDRLLIHPEDVIPAQQAQVVLTGAVGRPSFGISHHQLNYLIENRFSLPQIAK